MLQKFYPGDYVESSYAVDYERLWREGIRGIIFDIDNTLVHHGAPVDDGAIALMKRIKAIGFRVILISNNSPARVEPFATALEVPYKPDAHKPGKKSYLEAVEQIGTTVPTTIFIGDQIFTDIYGANRAGLRNILVKPLHPKEEIQIVLKRKLEKIVLHFYQKRKKKA